MQVEKLLNYVSSELQVVFLDVDFHKMRCLALEATEDDEYPLGDDTPGRGCLCRVEGGKAEDGICAAMSTGGLGKGEEAHHSFLFLR